MRSKAPGDPKRSDRTDPDPQHCRLKENPFLYRRQHVERLTVYSPGMDPQFLFAHRAPHRALRSEHGHHGNSSEGPDDGNLGSEDQEH